MIVNFLAGLIAFVGLVIAISGVFIAINPRAFFQNALRRASGTDSPMGSFFPDVKKSAFTRIALGTAALVLGTLILAVRLL